MVKKGINHDDYVNVVETNEAFKKKMLFSEACNHQLYTFKQHNIALTSFYDKVQMIDHISCIAYGYKPSTKIPPTEPDAEPDEEEKDDPTTEMPMGDMLRPIMIQRDDLDYSLAFGQWGHSLLAPKSS